MYVHAKKIYIYTVFDLISEHALISEHPLFFLRSLNKKKVQEGSLIRAFFFAENYISEQSAN